ncbi:unnamed protein product [Closterium sp. NIES-54]
MVRHRLVLGLPLSLAPLPRSPASPCTPCVKGPQRAAPHSSFPPTTAPFQTLHLDDWGPSPVLGPPGGGAQGLCGLRLHSDRGGEFSSTRLETFCQGGGIIQSYTLPDSPQQNRVDERRIGLPSDARPRVMPVSLWTGSPGVAADYRVWGCLAHVCTPGTNKLSAHIRACVFLGFPLHASGWQFYDPVTRQFLASQDITFDESVSYYRSHGHKGVSHVTPQSSSQQRPVPVVSGGAAAEGGGHGVVGPGGANSGGAGLFGVLETPALRTSLTV